jgi:hypothetical protein
MDPYALIAMAEANKHNEQRVFDWDKAARLIRERNVTCAEAGLANDWSSTGGTIYEEGAPIVDSYTFLASTWAVPSLILDGETVECWRMQSEVPDWDSGTKWPESALAILAGEAP